MSFQMRGIDQSDYKIKFMMVPSEKSTEVSYSSAEYSVQLTAVTFPEPQTVITFVTEYSNDANANINMDQKLKMQDNIKEMQLSFA